jgi:hypothetical protein
MPPRTVVFFIASTYTDTTRRIKRKKKKKKRKDVTLTTKTIKKNNKRKKGERTAWLARTGEGTRHRLSHTHTHTNRAKGMYIELKAAKRKLHRPGEEGSQTTVERPLQTLDATKGGSHCARLE